MKINTILPILLLTLFANQYTTAQAPLAIPYQAVARDSTGNLIVNQNISLRFSIRDSVITGIVVYSETQSATTNVFGLFTVNIGQGAVVSGNFSTINWGTGAKFIQVEMDAGGGSAYTDMGTQQMLSVPYALYSGNGGLWTANGTDISNTNTGKVGIGTIAPNQKLTVEGTGQGIAQQNSATGPSVGFYTNSSSAWLQTNNNYPLYFSTNDGSAQMTLTTEGKFGIGTIAPADALQIGSFSNAIDNYISVKSAGGNQFKCGIKLKHYNDLFGFAIESDEIVNQLRFIRYSGYDSIVSTAMAISMLTGNIGMGTTSPDNSAILDVASTSQGFLPPRMTHAQRQTIVSPAQGLIVYCTDCGTSGQPQYYDGTAWVNMIGGAALASAPFLTTNSIVSVTSTTAWGGGYIFDDGGASYTAKGVCWNTSSNPTTANAKTNEGSGYIGNFSSQLTGLMSNSIYYVRAYATNSIGTSYGNEVSFTTLVGIGDNFGGGKIAYILQSGDPGYVAGVNHGFLAASTDQSTGIQWNDSSTTTGATATAIGTGTANTNTIVSAQGAGTYAARLCADLVVNGYSDWYLPSKDELNKLYLNKNSIGGFGSGLYWSSSELAINSAWSQLFSNGNQVGSLKSDMHYVRAVRKFYSGPPIVSTNNITSIDTTAASGGNVTDDGGIPVTSRGVCWSTSPNPTTAGSITIDGSGIGSFTSSITGLTLGLTYYVRAYATNSIGTGYGNELSFTNTLGVGANFQGGKVAYIFQPADPGYVSGETHGLIAAAVDQSTGIQWNDSSTTTGATAITLGTGNANTNLIVSAQGAGTYAAQLCADLVLNGYSDWYLPSIEELGILNQNKYSIGGFSSDLYWSSSELAINSAWSWDFAFIFGSPVGSLKSDLSNVRAIRTF